MSLWQCSSTCIALCLSMLQPVWTHIFWIWAWKNVDRRIYIIESRIESSSEKNQLEIWMKNKCYHLSEMPFDENTAENRKVVELKKDGLYWYVLFVLHMSIIEMDLIDATFLQGLNHGKSVVIPSFVLNGLTQNVKIYCKKKFHRSLQTMQSLGMYRYKYTSEADIESICRVFVKHFWFLRIIMQEIEWGTEMLANACFSVLNYVEGFISVE